MQEVMNTKTTLLQRIFEKVQPTLSADKGFQQFVEENSEWLAPYAAFCHFRDEFKTSDFSKWKGHESITKVLSVSFPLLSHLSFLALL